MDDRDRTRMVDSSDRERGHQRGRDRHVDDVARRWRVNGIERHHLIDPRTGEPAATDLNLVSVIAGSAWTAEVLAKAVLIRGSEHPFDLVDGAEAHALVVDDDGRVTVSDGFREYLGFGWLPEQIERDAKSAG